jgi:RNA polymerase sigma-70 factor (ECF subfamily)
MLKDFNHPGVAAESKQEMQELFRAIHSLPENQQTALILTRIEDRSQKEVAEIMNVSVKAVESLLQRAKQALIKKLKNSEGI